MFSYIFCSLYHRPNSILKGVLPRIIFFFKWRKVVQLHASSIETTRLYMFRYQYRIHLCSSVDSLPVPVAQLVERWTLNWLPDCHRTRIARSEGRGQGQRNKLCLAGALSSSIPPFKRFGQIKKKISGGCKGVICNNPNGGNCSVVTIDPYDRCWRFYYW